MFDIDLPEIHNTTVSLADVCPGHIQNRRLEKREAADALEGPSSRRFTPAASGVLASLREPTPLNLDERSKTPSYPEESNDLPPTVPSDARRKGSRKTATSQPSTSRGGADATRIFCNDMTQRLHYGYQDVAHTCGVSFKNRENFRRHLREKTSSYTCGIDGCDKTFKRGTKVKKHWVNEHTVPQEKIPTRLSPSLLATRFE